MRQSANSLYFDAIPRIENWRFAEASSSLSLPEAPRLVEVSADGRGLSLRSQGAVVAQCQVPSTTTEALISPDQKWVWHLGIGGSTVVTLLDAETLRTVGSYRPREMYHPWAPTPPYLKSWWEYEAIVCRETPDILVISANAGDSFILLLALRATPQGIVDEVGTTLFEAARGVLDQTICGARFLSHDRFLIVDDIGTLTLFKWPSCDQVSVAYLMDALMGDGGSCSVWPESRPLEYLLIGWDTVVACDQLLVSIAGDEEPFELLAFASLDAASLKPNGLVRPPTTEMRGLQQVGDNLFVAEKSSGRKLLQLVPT